jgi:hypothetical protein
VRVWLRAVVLTVVLAWAIAAAPPAVAADILPLVSGRDSPRVGATAGDVWVSDDAPNVAVAADGTFAFSSDGRINWVAQGRVVRSEPFEVTDMAFTADGSLVVIGTPTTAPADTGVVWRYPRNGARVRLAGTGQEGSSGDRGPALEARFTCPWGLDVDAADAVMIADGCARRVRRVTTDGIIRTVAGGGVGGDGLPAARASLARPSDVASLADGSIAILDLDQDADRGTLRVVDPEGVIHSRLRTRATNLSADRDGGILLVDSRAWLARRHVAVKRFAPAGTLSAEVDKRNLIAMPLFIPLAGDPFGGDHTTVADAERLPDGGLLVAGNDAIHYVTPTPPAQPGTLAIALLPSTRIPRRDLRIALRVTQRADIDIEVRDRARVLATQRQTGATPGTSTVRLDRRLPPGLYEVRVAAAAGGEVAVTRGFVLVGGLLPVPYARSFIVSRTELFEVFSDAPKSTVTCRRYNPRRVDCGIVQRKRCAGIAVLRLLRTGALGASQYDGGRRARCRFRGRAS